MPLGPRCVYSGKERSCQFKDLAPCVKLVFRLRAYTEGDESPLSDPVDLLTEEAGKSPLSDPSRVTHRGSR